MTSELAWFKSSYSGGSGGDCIEVATSPATIHVRDSKDQSGPTLAFSPAAWAAFVSYAVDTEV
jgi:hypothetical protein